MTTFPDEPPWTQWPISVAAGLLMAQFGVDADLAMSILDDGSKVEDISVLDYAERLIADHEFSVSHPQGSN
ncbi:MAG: hypothetical protein QOK10_633 [Pseudonocardiales bacterium]|nr:hypothetical protein [Pseudonocardiales bacterium]